MTNVNNRSRVPSGVSTGGRFAAETKSEASVHLSAGAGRPSWEDHGEAVGRAALNAGLGDGHAYSYQSAAILTNPWGEPEAFINLTDDSGPAQLCHNYATGATTYSAPAAGIDKTDDPELVQVAVGDICGEYEGDTAGMFDRLRDEAVDGGGLHPGVRDALESPRAVSREEKAAHWLNLGSPERAAQYA